MIWFHCQKHQIKDNQMDLMQNSIVWNKSIYKKSMTEKCVQRSNLKTGLVQECAHNLELLNTEYSAGPHFRRG